MTTWVSITEATEQSSLSHQHIAYLLRNKKVNGRKTGVFWLVELESLKSYEEEMDKLGSSKHNPKKEDS